MPDCPRNKLNSFPVYCDSGVLNCIGRGVEDAVTRKHKNDQRKDLKTWLHVGDFENKWSQYLEMDHVCIYARMFRIITRL